MDRYITFTDTITGARITCDTYDIEAKLAPWFEGGGEEITSMIEELGDAIRAQAPTEALEAALGVEWTAAQILDMSQAADLLGITYSTVQQYRRRLPGFPAPDVMLGQSPGWWESTLLTWNAARPGKGGRPRRVAGEDR